MKLVRVVFVTLSLSFAVSSAQAQPVAISAASPNATTYSFFLINAKKAPGGPAVALASLTAAVAPYGVTPCILAADFNAAIVCGTPSQPTFMMGAIGEFYSYDLAFNMKDLPPLNDKKVFNKSSIYNQIYAVNFLSPVGTIPGGPAVVPAHVHFAVPVTEFSILVDGGNPIAMASDAIQFVVNGVTLDPQPLIPGTPIVVGVQDPNGFTDVGVIGFGGQSNAFIADRFAFVVKQ
jgi:hypothetical protein